MPRLRLASLALAGSLLFTAGCSMDWNNLFGCRSGCCGSGCSVGTPCCESPSCPTCFAGPDAGTGMPYPGGPALFAPPTTFPAPGTNGIPVGPPPRMSTIPNAAPMPSPPSH